MKNNNTSRQDLGDVLYCIENSVEYWTFKISGESGMSHSGLAKLCGVTPQAIDKLIKNLPTQKCHNRLKHWQNQDIYLPTAIKKRGGVVKILKSAFCFSVVKHYAILGSEVADNALDAIGEIGINSWLQGKTGWLPHEYQASQSSRDRLNRILEKGCPWEKLYTKELCVKVQKWFGFDSSKFYWWYCYNWMTQEERNKLDEVNPLSEKGQRKRKIHQHFDVATKERMTEFAKYLGDCIDFCDSRTEFEKKWSRKYGTPEQLELFDLWNFAE